MTGWDAVAAQAVREHGAIQKTGELSALLAVLEQVRPRVIIEIGSDAGGTLWAWSQLPGPPRVISVDLPTGGFRLRSTDGRPAAHGAELVTGSSRSRFTQNEVIALLRGALADVLFIDGDHTYQGVSSDFWGWRKLLRPGGLAVFHDIATHGRPDVGVPYFWRDLATWWPRNQLMEIRTDREAPWGGIGILCDRPQLVPEPARVNTR